MKGKKQELRDMNITHISYVNKAANKTRFFLLKAEEEPAFEKEIPIFINKAEEAKKLVYGIVYEPDVVDTQGDFATAEEIEKAAHNFMENARNIDLQHNFKAGYGSLQESYIAPADFKIGETNIKKGAWVIVTKATDEVWESIQKGEITGYSMGGSAVKTAVEENKLEKQEINSDEVKGFFNVVKSFFVKSDNKEVNENIEKAGKSISNSNMEQIQNAYNALGKLIESVNSKESEETEVNKEDVNQIVKAAVEEAVKPLNERLASLEGTSTEVAKAEEVTKAEEIRQIVKSTIEAALNPVNERLSRVEKAKGISNQITEPDEIKKSNNTWVGLDI